MTLPESGGGAQPEDATAPSEVDAEAVPHVDAKAEPEPGGQVDAEEPDTGAAGEASRPFPDPEHSITPRRPRTLGGAVFLGVLAGTLGGLALVVWGPWRTGLGVIGGSMIAGALGRLVIRDGSAGMLGVRRKVVDVATMFLLGAALCALAVVIPNQPPP